MERVILHCDLNNFFASVECMLTPTLRESAVAVCGSVKERRGIVLAKNELAKTFGVATGETVWKAKQQCPALVTVSPRYEEYLRYATMARAIYGRYTDQVEPFGMDECWLDVTESRRLGTGPALADEIRRTVKAELGLTISVGVSFNKIFAKLGSDLKKPDAVTVIDRESFRERIWGLPASAMVGVGSATEKVLAKYGITTIGQLAAAPEEFLRYRFGKNGRILKRNANGWDDTPVTREEKQPPAKSVGHGVTTARDLAGESEVWRLILELFQDIGKELRQNGKKAGGVAIAIRDSDLQTKEWQCHMRIPTRSAMPLAEAAFALFQSSYDWSKPIHSVTVRAIDLTEEEKPFQYDLFTDAESWEKQERLETAVEEIRERFGQRSIRNAVLCRNLKEYGNSLAAFESTLSNSAQTISVSSVDKVF